MANIESHAPGAFCWVELATTDQQGAKTFYTSLFGWDVSDLPMGPGEVYTMFQIAGRDAAAACTIGPQERAMGVPPSWTVYVAVDSADRAAERAGQLGATVLAPPFDVGEHGRMAVLKDPTGAVVAVWQAKAGIGIQIAGVDGTVCWADLSTPEQDRAATFYAALFGWTIVKEDEVPEHNYYHIKNGDEFIGGIPPATYRNPHVPAHWQVYFQVGDCDAAAATAQRLGARVYMPPTTIEDLGRIAVLADPQGATFALYGP